MPAFIRYRIFVFQFAIQILKIKLYRTISWPVLYECKTWSLSLREEHTPKVVESRVLKRLYGIDRDEVTGELRKLHNEELHGLFSPNIFRVMKSKRMRCAGHVARMGERRGVHRVLLGKPEGKRPLWRPWLRWEDNIKKDL